MEIEKKVLSREIQQYLYESGQTVGTAESCTGGRIAEAIIAVPGASAYFKGGIVCYTNEVKENLLGVDHQLLEEKLSIIHISDPPRLRRNTYAAFCLKKKIDIYSLS